MESALQLEKQHEQKTPKEEGRSYVLEERFPVCPVVRLAVDKVKERAGKVI